jgi:hypothetical protein
MDLVKQWDLDLMREEPRKVMIRHFLTASASVASRYPFEMKDEREDGPEWEALSRMEPAHY